MRKYTCALAATFTFLIAAGARGGVLFQYPDFTNTAGLTFTGAAGTAATSDGTVLRVTPANYSQSGAAYSTAAVPLGVSNTFSTVFQFRFTNPGGIDPADGITFVLAASPAGLGGAGVGIGYSGVPNSVAIEFDTYNNGFPDSNSSNHIGIDMNGALNDAALANVYGVQTCEFAGNSYKTAGCMSDGNLWTATISYDGSNLTTLVTDAAKGTSFLAINKYPIDLVSLLGTTTAYVGFTSGTGSGYENHDILNWDFSNTAAVIGPAVPEPGTTVLFATGLLVGACALRRRRRS